MNTYCKNISKSLTKTCVVISLSLGLSGFAMASTQLQLHAEYAAIDSTMQTMMQAFEQGDAAKAHRVILPDTVVVGYSTNQQKVVICQAKRSVPLVKASLPNKCGKLSRLNNRRSR